MHVHEYSAWEVGFGPLYISENLAYVSLHPLFSALEHKMVPRTSQAENRLSLPLSMSSGTLEGFV